MKGTLGFDEAVCECGRRVRGRLAGAKTRGSKQMRMFECNCGHRWAMEVVNITVSMPPSNGHSNGNGHKVSCPCCGHEFKPGEVKHG